MRLKKAILVAGLGFGDEGKGTIVDYLTRQHKAHTIVRYNGGAQAGHNVVTKDGRQHVFAQFGSGTFVPGTRTHLSKFMIVNPKTMVNENLHLKEIGIEDAFTRTTIDGDALISTPYHKMANWLRESCRGEDRHGSCGMGIGETAIDYALYGNRVLFAKDLKNQKTTREKMEFIRSKKQEAVLNLNLKNNEFFQDILKNLYSNLFLETYVKFYHFFSTQLANIVESNYLNRYIDDGVVIFEGAQGIMLDSKYGFPPHITKTDITFNNAMTLLKEVNYDGQIKRIGVLRTYFTRHGAGPFPTEDENLTQLLLDSHNPEGPWQGKFRVGYFDMAAAKYAIKCIGGLDEIAITNGDRLIGLEPLKVSIGYDSNKQPVYKDRKKIESVADVLQYLKFIQDSIEIPITILSLGPTAEDKMVTYPVY